MSLRAYTSTVPQTQESEKGFKLTSFSPTRVSLKQPQVGCRYPISTSSLAVTGLVEQGFNLVFLLKLLHPNPEEREDKICFALAFHICFNSVAQSGLFVTVMAWFYHTIELISSSCNVFLSPWLNTLFDLPFICDPPYIHIRPVQR